MRNKHDGRALSGDQEGLFLLKPVDKCKFCVIMKKKKLKNVMILRVTAYFFTDTLALDKKEC